MGRYAARYRVMIPALLCIWWGVALGGEIEPGPGASAPRADMFGQSPLAVGGGAACGPGRELCVAPLVGLDHRKREASDPARALTRHDINVRAGWRLSLFDAMELSTFAGLPLLQAELTEGVVGGELRSGATTRIRGGEQPFSSMNGMTWGSDIRLKVNEHFNLNLFYDYGRTLTGTRGQSDRDERFGTRLEFRFK